jgi:hypothetical protein
VASLGFQTIARCDCFALADGGSRTTLHCYLATDYSYLCAGEHARSDVLALGLCAIVLFGLGVPTMQVCLLYAARHDIRATPKVGR